MQLALCPNAIENSTMDRASGTLTGAQLAELRTVLANKRAELRRTIEARLRQRAEDDEELTEDVDVATRGIGTVEIEGVVEVDRRLLADVEHALDKIDAGRFGLSEASGEPIPYARLKAVPWARYDADEEEERERDRRST
jgi:DnaK suppressor protein